MKVPDITIRKDLTALEDKGLLRRAHGFATFPESNDVSKRLLFNYETKRRIDKKDRRGVTIITNSVFIAIFLRDKVGARIILLGGEFQPEAQVMVGSLVIDGRGGQ